VHNHKWTQLGYSSYSGCNREQQLHEVDVIRKAAAEVDAIRELQLKQAKQGKAACNICDLLSKTWHVPLL